MDIVVLKNEVFLYPEDLPLSALRTMLEKELKKEKEHAQQAQYHSFWRAKIICFN